MITVDRILVIDDDVELCTLVGEYLAPEGFLVECAHDGKRGLEAAVTGEHLLVVLDALLREAGHVVPRERLVDIVLSRKFSPFDRSIDMHVSKIRKKLGDSEGANDHIKTVRGVGYIFARPQERPQDETSGEKARSSRS